MSMRAASIAAALVAMRRLGVNQIIDFTIKERLPIVLLEHIAQAAMLMDQDRFILSLPIVKAKEGTLVIMDEMTVIRSEPTSVVEIEDQDGSTAESLPESCDQEEIEPEIDLLLAEQVVRQTYGEDHGNGDSGDMPFGWPV